MHLLKSLDLYAIFSENNRSFILWYLASNLESTIQKLQTLLDYFLISKFVILGYEAK